MGNYFEIYNSRINFARCRQVVHPSKSHRFRTMPFIFLDQISTTANLTKDEDDNVSNDEHWRKSLVQTVTIPDLEHLEIRSKYVRSSEAVWRPDGSTSKELQEQIRNHVETFSSELVIDKEDTINEPKTKAKKSNKTNVNKQKQKAIRNHPHVEIATAV